MDLVEAAAVTKVGLESDLLHLDLVDPVREGAQLVRQHSQRLTVMCASLFRHLRGTTLDRLDLDVSCQNRSVACVLKAGKVASGDRERAYGVDQPLVGLPERSLSDGVHQVRGRVRSTTRFVSSLILRSGIDAKLTPTDSERNTVQRSASKIGLAPCRASEELLLSSEAHELRLLLAHELLELFLDTLRQAEGIGPPVVVELLRLVEVAGPVAKAVEVENVPQALRELSRGRIAPEILKSDLGVLDFECQHTVRAAIGVLRRSSPPNLGYKFCG